MAFEDTILLSIKREYTENEKIAFLVQKVRELQFENGVLKSDIEERKHKKKIYGLVARKRLRLLYDKVDFLEKEKTRYHKKWCVQKKINALMNIFIEDTIESKYYYKFAQILKRKGIEYHNQYNNSRVIQDKINENAKLKQ